MTEVCPICGADTLESRHGDFLFEPPQNISGGVITIKGATWQECSSCEEQILSKELESALEKCRYSRLGLLTPVEIREIRNRTGLNQVEMAQLLGVGDKTYTRWETGKSLHNKSNDNLIRLVDQHVEILSQIDVQRQPDREILVGKYISSLECLKGNNQLAIAAHGGELEPSIAYVLRKRLLDFVSHK
jgi:putative zinc finger/helix-turn-helix YgiT family protein